MHHTMAQEQFLTKTGYISFYSSSILEDIEAESDQVLSIVDRRSGKIAIQVLMRTFQFEKSLMQEHFNENYMESHKYPKAKFLGHIEDFGELELKNGKVEIVGKLALHGVERKIRAIADIEVNDDAISLKGSFDVETADYNIKIPALVRDNIAKIINVRFELHHEPYK